MNWPRTWPLAAENGGGVSGPSHAVLGCSECGSTARPDSSLILDPEVIGKIFLGKITNWEWGTGGGVRRTGYTEPVPYFTMLTRSALRRRWAVRRLGHRRSSPGLGWFHTCRLRCSAKVCSMTGAEPFAELAGRSSHASKVERCFEHHCGCAVRNVGGGG